MIDIKNKKVLLLGLGLHGGGVSCARWLIKEGARLVVSDLRNGNVLRPSLKSLNKYKNISYVLGKHRKRDVVWADFVVYNPGVPKESKYLQLARRLNKPVYNEASLFFDRCRAPVIAVTGTRGKSTTSVLLAQMLEDFHIRVILAGNIKTAFMLDVVDRASKKDVVILELSSWQLEGLNIVRGAPNMAIITNLYPDHLNRYKNLAQYWHSKKEIFRHQDKNHFIVLNYDNNLMRDWGKESCSRELFFSKKDHKKDGSFIKRGKIIFRAGGKEHEVGAVKNVALPGEHNLENILASTTAAKICSVSNKAIKNSLKKNFVLPGRQEEIAKIKGVRFVNDTASTTPQAGIAALLRFGKTSKFKKKRIILIAGGADKELKYSEWAREVKRYCKYVYLLSGKASEKMKKNLQNFQAMSFGHNNFEFIIKDVEKNMKKGDIVLFSPAAASFNLWSHEFERGNDFNKAVEQLQ